METAAMQAEKAACCRDREWSRSPREKFLQAWDAKVKRQHAAILSAQEPACQSTVGIPTQGHGTRDTPCAHLQRGAEVQPNENAFYVLRVETPPQEQQCSNPGDVSAPSHYPLGLPASQPERSSLHPEDEGEFTEICVSDLLLQSPGRKRPRLLPPDIKMYVEVRKGKESRSPQEDERSPVPPEYNHLVDSMVVTKPSDLAAVEAFYRRFRPRRIHRRIRPVDLLGEGPSPARGMEAATYPQRATKRSHRGHLLHNPNANVPFSDLTAATKESMKGHLPPKKRYTQSCF